MLIKGSNVSPSIRIGIIKLRIFSVYSNNNQIKFFGVIKGSVSKSNRLKKSYLGLKLKCYLLKTKKTCSRIDGSGLFLYRNVMYINHKKLKKFKKNYGICQKIIKHRKYIFKFPFLLLMFNNINRPNTNIKFFLLSYDIEQFNILVFTKLNFNLFINSLNFLFFFYFFFIFFLFFFYNLNSYNKKPIISLLYNLNITNFYDFINVIIIFFFFNFFYINLYLNYSNVITYLLFIFIQPIVLLPIIYILPMLTNLLLCANMIKQKSIISTIFYDFLILVAYVSRFLSQFVRVILMLTISLLVHETFNSFLLKSFLDWFYFNENQLFELINVLGRTLFELFDWFLIFFVQFNMFFIFLIWLISFLFSIKYKNIFEL